MFFSLVGGVLANAYGASQIKIICDKDGEEVYLNKKFKTECDKDEVVRLMVKEGRHTIEVKKTDKEAKYSFKTKFRIGDGVQKVIEPKVQPLYNEYHYYKQALQDESLQSCSKYLQKYPHGKYRKQIMQLQAYLEAKKDFSKYAKFKRTYPKSEFLQKLKKHYIDNPLIATLRGHTKGVETLSLTKDGSKLFSGGDDEKIIEWDLKSNEIVKTFSYSHDKGGTLSVTTTALSDDENYLYSDGRSAFRKWNVKTGKGEIIADFWPEKILILDKSEAITCRGDRVDIWNLNERKIVFTYYGNDGYSANLYGCTLTKNKNYLYFGQYDDKLQKNVLVRFDVQTRKIDKKYINDKLRSTIKSIALSPDERNIFSATREGEILVWDAKNGSVVKVLKQEGNIVSAAASAKRGLIATGSTKGSVTLWDAPTGIAIKTIYTYVGVNALRFNQDGTKLFCALDNGDIQVWYVGFYDKASVFSSLLDECESGNVTACNDYIVNGGTKKKIAKTALLKQLKNIIQANGGEITYTNPKLFLYKHKNTDKLTASNAKTLYSVETIVQNAGKTYILVDMDFHNTGFTFNAPIYLQQGSNKKNYTQKIPSDYKIKIGTQDVKVVFVYDDFPLEKGSYTIIEGDDPSCSNCLRMKNGEIVKIY